MKRPRLLWQLYPTYLLITVLALLAVIWVGAGFLRQFYFSETVSQLEINARLISPQLQEAATLSHPERLHALVADLARQAGARITLVRWDGTILADSEEDSQTMDNHADRPEIMRALDGEQGVSRRFSNTLQKNLIYLARPMPGPDQTKVVLRLAIPQPAFENALRGVYGKIALSGLVIFLLSALVSYLVARRISQPLVEMKQSAEAFARGDFSRKLWVPRTVEIGGLAESLNQMAKELDERIRTITRQRAEQEAVFGSMQEGVLAVDREERVIDVNPLAVELFGTAVDQPQGRSLPEVIRNPQVHAFVKNALNTSEPQEEEIALYESGERFLVARSAVLKDEQGGARGVVVVFNDITRRKQLENIRRDFVANVSHELKTPITLIQGFIETLHEGALDNPAEAKRFLKIIWEHSQRLHAIVEDLLSLSRVEQMKESQMQTQEEILSNIVGQAIAACQPQADAKEITFAVTIPPRLSVRVNAVLVEQALVNLIDNAVKFSEAKTEICLQAKSEGPDIRVDIQDQGCGIEAQEQGRIFERFYRVDKARSRKAGGTGLGLAIVKHIMNAHQGRISVASAPGQGSTFTVYLPKA